MTVEKHTIRTDDPDADAILKTIAGRSFPSLGAEVRFVMRLLLDLGWRRGDDAATNAGASGTIGRKSIAWADKELQAVIAELGLDAAAPLRDLASIVKYAMELLIARGWASGERVAELLAANNAEVERRRGAERCTFEAQEAAKEMREGVEVADTLLNTAEAIIEELLALLDAVQADADDNQHKLDGVRHERDRLHLAARALYLAAHWSADRSCDAQALWAELRDAIGLKPGAATAALGEPRSAGLNILWLDLPSKLFDAIANGDAEHRAWLKSAIEAFWMGNTVPKPPTQRKPDETGWLIETETSNASAPLYLARIGRNDWGWSFGHLCALRFSRKEDAEKIVAGLGLKARVCDHAWVQP
jgi:hypothetical protein